MITLGQLLGSFIKGNPGLVIVSTEDIKKGIPMEVTGIKIAESKTDGSTVVVLTI